MLPRWLFEKLIYSKDQCPLSVRSRELVCANGHAYPVVDGVPVLLCDDIAETHWTIGASIHQAGSYCEGDSLYFVETLAG
jgi:uncharacterized protein YbaR (Trm112 family)